MPAILTRMTFSTRSSCSTSLGGYTFCRARARRASESVIRLLMPSAETNAAARGIPIGQIIHLRLCEPDLRIRELPQALTPMRLLEMGDLAHRQIPHDHFVDCMDLWELSCGLRGVPQDKSQRLGILAIREERRSFRLHRLYHIVTHFMLADPMTKHIGYVSKKPLRASYLWSLVSWRQGSGTAQIWFQEVIRKCLFRLPPASR